MWCWWGGGLYFPSPSWMCYNCVSLGRYIDKSMVPGWVFNIQTLKGPMWGGWREAPQLTKGEQKRDPENCPHGKLCVWLSAASRKADCLIHLQFLVTKCFNKCDLCLWLKKNSCLKEERATKHCLRCQKQSRPGKLVLKNARVLGGRSNHSPDIWNMRQSSCKCLTQGIIIETPTRMGSLTLWEEAL